MICSFIVFFTFLQLATQQISFTCQEKLKLPPNTVDYKGSISGLQTGSIRVSQQQAMISHSFSVTFGKSFPNPTVALAIQNIQNYSPTSGKNFVISMLGKIDTKFEGNIQIEGQWNMIELSYVVSNRQDFIVGEYVADQNTLKSTGRNTDTTLTFKHIVPFQGRMSPEDWIVMPFITGLKTLSQNCQVQIVDLNVNPQRKQLTLSIHFRQDVSFLQMSYLLFHNRDDLQATNIHDVTNIPSQLDSFYGVVEVQPAMYKMGIIIQKQASFDFPYQTSQSPQVEQICVSKAHCQLEGGNMQFQRTSPITVIPKCILCSSNSHFVDSKCECLPGYQLTQNGCSKGANLSNDGAITVQGRN